MAIVRALGEWLAGEHMSFAAYPEHAFRRGLVKLRCAVGQGINPQISLATLTEALFQLGIEHYGHVGPVAARRPTGLTDKQRNSVRALLGRLASNCNMAAGCGHACQAAALSPNEEVVSTAYGSGHCVTVVTRHDGGVPPLPAPAAQHHVKAIRHGEAAPRRIR